MGQIQAHEAVMRLEERGVDGESWPATQLCGCTLTPHSDWVQAWKCLQRPLLHDGV